MRRLHWLVPVISVALIAAFGVAFAHEGEKHESKTLLGTVKNVKKDKVEIETPEGQKVTVALAADTEYTKDGEDITKDAVEPGMRVAMQVTEDEHGKMVCHRMRLGAMMGDTHRSSPEHEHQGGDAEHDPHRH